MEKVQSKKTRLRCMPMLALAIAVLGAMPAWCQNVATELRHTLDALASPVTRAALSGALQHERDRLNESLKSQQGAAHNSSNSERLRAIESALQLVPGNPGAAPAFSDDAIVFFESKIRPILIANCQSCHGAEKQKSNLRLDSREAILKGGDHGAAVVPGDASASLMAAAVLYTGDIKMPPDSKLEQDKIEALIEWVTMGAPWPQGDKSTASGTGSTADIEKGRAWWAFRPVGDMQAPEAKNTGWVKNPIDRFIAAKLEADGIVPAAPADKRTLIRRATFDLIGLPPTPEEVHAFLADGSADAFARVIDRLLASPHYGERWGRHWLDVVRYTDSFDSRATDATDPVNSWRYRDWVINAFNSDMPYDRFVKYQIAGDLLPDPGHPDTGFNRDGTIATAMLAIGNWPQGDADKQKMLTDIVDDQIDVVSRGIMGVTMGCARCHDHKFDPFTTRDYYGLAGIFFSSHILPGPGQKTEGSPILHIPLVPPAEEAEREAYIEHEKSLVARVADRTNALRQRVTRDMLVHTSDYLNAAWDISDAMKDKGDSSPASLALHRGLNVDALMWWMDQLGLSPLRVLRNSTANLQGNSGLVSWTGPGGMPSATINTTGNEVVYATIKQPARSVVVHPSPAAAVGVSWRSPSDGDVTVCGAIADADATCGNGVTWRIEHRSGAVANTLAEGAIDNGGKANFAAGPQTLAPLHVAAGDYVILAIDPRGDYSCDSTVVDISIADATGGSHVWRLAPDLMKDPLQSNPHADSMGCADVWAFSNLGSSPTPADSPLAAWIAATTTRDRATVVVASRAVQNALDAVLAVLAANGNDASKLPDDASTRFYKYLVSEQGPYSIDPLSLAAPEFAEDKDQLATARHELDELRAHPLPAIDYSEGIQEGGTPNTEHAGIADAPIHKRGSYTQLGDIVPRGFPAVLVRGEQPQITGSGRKQLAEWVASAENPLTARVMVNRIWQHHFGEGIVRTPGNFGKQGAAPTHPELLDYLAQQFVQSGWSIKALHRMIMLSATYRQCCTPSAPGIDPENLDFGRMNRRRLEAEPLRDAMLSVSGKLDVTLGGKAFPDIATPRRTVYFRTVRSDRTSYTMLFDAADPTAIVDKRTESTVAPQALYLINNPFVLEQARSLAERATAMQSPDDSARIGALYELLYARPARDEEVAIGGKVLASVRAATPGDEIRPWQEYCQILLCSNEFAFVD